MAAVVVYDECDGGDGDGPEGFWDRARRLCEDGAESAGGLRWAFFVAVPGRGADAECPGGNRCLLRGDAEDVYGAAFCARDDGGCDVGDELRIAAAGGARSEANTDSRNGR